MDGTMCKGDGCPVKSSCYRHEATPSDVQSYFVSTPGKYGPVEDGLFGKQAEWECEYRIEIRDDQIK